MESRIRTVVSRFYDHVMGCPDCWGRVGLRTPQDHRNIPCRSARRIRKMFDAFAVFADETLWGPDVREPPSRAGSRAK